MIDSATIDAVKRIIEEEAQTDIVGLWVVLRDIHDAAPKVSTGQARQATLTAIRHALLDGSVIAGYFEEQDEDTVVLVQWGPSPTDILARIEREWDALGREPTIGDIVWFCHPSLLPVTAVKYPMGKGWEPERS